MKWKFIRNFLQDFSIVPVNKPIQVSQRAHKSAPEKALSEVFPQWKVYNVFITFSLLYFVRASFHEFQPLSFANWFVCEEDVMQFVDVLYDHILNLKTKIKSKKGKHKISEKKILVKNDKKKSLSRPTFWF